MSIWRNITLATAAVVVLGSASVAKEAMVPSGSITIDETQFGFLIGGNVGGGKLRFHGKTYDFKIGGISIGDLGVSKVRGAGRVYNLTDVSQFAGTYAKVDASATLVKGSGALRLKNDKGVVLDVMTRSGGLQLSAGAGGVKISM
ncbi:MAG: DUF1134 domain-containing protein [Janthinobacterium lividum]